MCKQMDCIYIYMCKQTDFSDIYRCYQTDCVECLYFYITKYGYVYMCLLECDEVSACHATCNKQYYPKFENNNNYYYNCSSRT